MNRHSQRIALNIAIIFSLFFMPWWFSAFLVSFGLFFFQPFYEALPAAFIIDILYGTVSESFFLTFPATLSASFLFLLSFWVREYIRLGNRVS